ncbi:hypothetical protein NB037_01915 [Rathayibacter sp. ZW T2_19]|uniref:Uncharacterized protein n=1 Tax=Rathayibacter rubneri TaxID=2950106 RepID=A0A9X2DXT4_9MICO|nr:hypothetical protein [Rathayibacter rubneri]MCM6761164.1 hypothetical protein [Rathayibacter rubneri]
MLLLLLAALGVFTLWWALRIMSFVLVATLVAATFLAIHGLRIRAWQKIAVHVMIGVLGLAVIALELAVH